MDDDELEAFSLDDVTLQPLPSLDSLSIAATPSSLLRLQQVDPLPSHSRHSPRPHPPSPILVAPSSPRFPFPSVPGSPRFSWSPAASPSSPFRLTERDYICIDANALGRSPPPSNATPASPPSPLGLPGTFSTWASGRESSGSEQLSNSARRTSRTREYFEGELLLPPPFLDDRAGTSRKSFEGILGTRSARHAEKLHKRHEYLYALGRGPTLPFPNAVISGMRKLLRALGPPAGSHPRVGRQEYHGPEHKPAERFKLQQRQKVRRAESAVQLHTLGSHAGQKLATKLRRSKSCSRIPEHASRRSNLVRLSSAWTSIADLLVWILVGSSSSASLGGLVAVFVHVTAFAYFIVTHAAALVLELGSAFRTTIVFAYWVTLNLLGKTDTSRAMIAYWKNCRKEWDRVCLEEERGQPLSVWSVLTGLAELVALHSMTRKRWLQEELVCFAAAAADPPAEQQYRDRNPPLERPSSDKTRDKTRDPTIRPQFVMNRSSFYWSKQGAAEEGGGLVVISNGDVLEGTLIGRAETQRTSANARSQIVEPVSAQADDKQFVSTLKRCGRLSTAAYGLQTYIVSPPTPLLTPSGATLPHRLFAHLGGVQDHRHVLHVALQGTNSQADIVYAPTFYILRDDSHRQVVVVFRGTQSLADIKTDLEGEFLPLHLENDERTTSSDPSTPYRIHCGILAAARHLLDPERSPLFSKLATALEETGYDLVLTGHSLGSAVASTVALLASSYNSTTNTWSISASSGLPSDRSIRAITFAHPTTLNAALATRCALGTPPLVVSVSLENDLITRAGLPQLRELRRTLGRLDRTRTERNSSSILSQWWKWRKLKTGLAEVEELEDDAWKRRISAEARDRRRLDGPDSAVPAGKTFHLSQLEQEPSIHRRQAQGFDNHDEGDEDEDTEDVPVRYGVFEVKDPSSFYRSPILASDLIKSHMPMAYLDAITSL
ncbi:lipase family protein [Sporobolomyces koalae]|uniref:lipase family protein n=1 Tax=Sporobolomyces koalae TaxID=500713 RepID=UPI00317E5151